MREVRKQGDEEKGTGKNGTECTEFVCILCFYEFGVGGGGVQMNVFTKRRLYM